jgi:hypothetical protein
VLCNYSTIKVFLQLQVRLVCHGSWWLAVCGKPRLYYFTFKSPCSVAAVLSISRPVTPSQQCLWLLPRRREPNFSVSGEPTTADYIFDAIRVM